MQKFRIAILQDEEILPGGHRQSFSDRWIALGNEQGHEIIKSDAFSMDLFQDLKGCHGLLWRFGYFPPARLLAKRLLPAIKQGAGIPTFPDSNTAWHFEDKISQYYLLEASGFPQPETRIFWNREQALGYSETASYPFVIKLAHGFRSSNVQLVRTCSEAKAWINEMFGPGLSSLSTSPTLVKRLLRRLRTAGRLLLGLRARGGADYSHGYFYAQEFLPDNDFDIRITVIGNRAFGFRRFNRNNDFRASGSGHIDWDPNAIEMNVVRLCFNIARELRTQSVAIDILRKNDGWVVSEISYTGASWAIAKCPGHWRWNHENGDDRIEWIDGSMRPEDAIFEDFVGMLTHAYSETART